MVLGEYGMFFIFSKTKTNTMKEIRIGRLVKCLLAAGCLAVAVTNIDSGLAAPCALGYAFLTMWVYLGFPAFAAFYRYIWTWSSIMGMLGSLGAIVTLLTVTLGLVVVGVVAIPIIFLLTLLGLLTNRD